MGDIAMTIRYPNGQSYNKTQKNSKPTNTNIVKNNESFSNRGMRLEELINESNDYYLAHDICVVHKKPTPITIVSVDYTRRSSAKIKEAYFQVPSTTDYNGVYKCKYLDFEAKECKNNTSFPLQNFHEHQIKHMEKVLKHGAICFIIFHFSNLNQIFLLDAEVVIRYWNDQTNGGRKSIPKKVIEEQGIEIKMGFMPPIDYIQVVEKVYF